MWTAAFVLALMIPARTVWQDRGRGIVEQIDLIPIEQFTEPNVTRLARQFLAGNAQTPVIRYLIVVDEHDARGKLRGLGATDIEYSNWREMYLKEGDSVPPTAEMIKIRDRAGLRIRYASGRVVEKVLRGPSPFEYLYEGERLRLHGVAVCHEGVPGGWRGKMAQFFFQTPKAWSEARAESFSRWFRRSLGVDQMEVDLVNGWWFVGPSNYPIYNRFIPHWPPPTLEEFTQSRRYFCWYPDGRCYSPSR